MSLLTQNTATELLEQKTQIVKVLVSDMSTGLTIQKAMESPKMFQVQKRIGMDNLIKLLCVIIKCFCDSIRAKNTMDTVDIFECAELIAETYTHDSVNDIVMALKQAKKKGHSFYNSISTPVVFEIVTEYINNKSSYIEKREMDSKSSFDGSVRTEAYTVAASVEKAQKEREKTLEEKTLKALQSEKKEIQKIENFLKDNINKMKE
jgi:transposase